MGTQRKRKTSESMMLTMKKETDIHEFSRQLKDHLGEDFWVMLESRAPAGPGNLKLFGENNFKLPKNFHHLYSDTNGVSLTWGHNSSPTDVKGHLGIEIETLNLRGVISNNPLF